MLLSAFHQNQLANLNSLITKKVSEEKATKRRPMPSLKFLSFSILTQNHSQDHARS